MKYQEILQEIISAGQNPNDFNITISENGCKVEPRGSYEPRKIAKEEDAIIKADIDYLAIMTGVDLSV